MVLLVGLSLGRGKPMAGLAQQQKEELSAEPLLMEGAAVKFICSGRHWPAPWVGAIEAVVGVIVERSGLFDIQGATS